MHKLLRRKQQELQLEWATGAFGDQIHFESVALDAKAKGIHQCLEQVIELDYGAILGGLSDE